MSYRLSLKAEDDIITLYLVGARDFGAAQAERYVADLETTFDFLGEHPRAGRERTEISPPVRIHPYRSHLIVYLLENDDQVLILRVRHGREDWTSGPATGATP